MSDSDMTIKEILEYTQTHDGGWEICGVDEDGGREWIRNLDGLLKKDGRLYAKYIFRISSDEWVPRWREFTFSANELPRKLTIRSRYRMLIHAAGPLSITLSLLMFIAVPLLGLIGLTACALTGWTPVDFGAALGRLLLSIVWGLLGYACASCDSDDGGMAGVVALVFAVVQAVCFVAGVAALFVL